MAFHLHTFWAGKANGVLLHLQRQRIVFIWPKDSTQDFPGRQPACPQARKPASPESNPVMIRPFAVSISIFSCRFSVSVSVSVPGPNGGCLAYYLCWLVDGRLSGSAFGCTGSHLWETHSQHLVAGFFVCKHYELNRANRLSASRKTRSKGPFTEDFRPRAPTP